MFSDEEGNALPGMPVIQITMNFVEMDGKTKVISRSQFESAETLQQIMDIVNIPSGRVFNFADSEENYFAVMEKK